MVPEDFMLVIERVLEEKLMGILEQCPTHEFDYAYCDDRDDYRYAFSAQEKKESLSGGKDKGNKDPRDHLVSISSTPFFAESFIEFARVGFFHFSSKLSFFPSIKWVNTLPLREADYQRDKAFLEAIARVNWFFEVHSYPSYPIKSQRPT